MLVFSIGGLHELHLDVSILQRPLHCAAPGRVYTKRTGAASGLVWTPEPVLLLGVSVYPRGPELYLDVS
jgi:hypothetical protein